MLGFYNPSTAKVIRTHDLGLKSHPEDWRRLRSNSGPLVYKASSLTTTPRRLLKLYEYRDVHSGGNTIGPTCGVHRANHIPHMKNLLLTRSINSHPYTFGQQPISLELFTIMAWSKAIILGQQPFCAELT